jgi:ABC-2 type transport system ATP-binding protein
MRGWEGRRRRCSSASTSTGAADRITAGFSHGMSRRLSVVLAAFHEPPLLLLDEPFDGVDPLGVEATMEAIAAARGGGTAVLVSTHLLELAVEACEEAVVLRGGRVVGAAPAAELAGRAGAAR